MIDLSSVNEPAVKRALDALAPTIDLRKLSTKGANGYVAFGHHTILKRGVAVKCYYWGGDDRYHAEPRRLAEIESPNVTEIHHAEKINDEWSLFITPYYKNGDLDDLIASGMPSTHEAIDLVSGVLSGLTHLHSRSLIHRDLKPENIFLSDSQEAVIGDFGSVKKIPETEDRIPGSGHSLLYRPPESVEHNMYGRTGDIYQSGLLLYQLLGGPLPHAEVAWLSKQQRKQYNEMSDPVDRTLFVDQVLKQRIARGRLLSTSEMNPWVPDPLLRVVRKAANKQPSSRYPTAANFMATLDKAKGRVPDWRKREDHLLMEADGVRRRVREVSEGTWRVERPRGTGWQKDGLFSDGPLSGVAKAVTEKYTR